MISLDQSEARILTSCRKKKFCHPMAMLTAQMTRVLTLSSTILVVAVNSLVTEIPAKLKKAIDTTVPEKRDKIYFYYSNLKKMRKMRRESIVRRFSFLYIYLKMRGQEEDCGQVDRLHRKHPRGQVWVHDRSCIKHWPIR